MRFIDERSERLPTLRGIVAPRGFEGDDRAQAASLMAIVMTLLFAIPGWESSLEGFLTRFPACGD